MFIFQLDYGIIPFLGQLSLIWNCSATFYGFSEVVTMLTEL